MKIPVKKGVVKFELQQNFETFDEFLPNTCFKQFCGLIPKLILTKRIDSYSNNSAEDDKRSFKPISIQQLPQNGQRK